MSTTESPQSLFEEFPAVDLAAWTAKVEDELGPSALDDVLEWSSLEGVTMPAYLQREALEEVTHLDPNAPIPPLAEAAEAPANTWTVCQTIDHPDPETANQLARSAVTNGAEALQLILSPPPPPPDRGLALESVDDLATVLDGIDLTTTGLHLGRELRAPVLYGTLREHLSDQGLDPDGLHGSVLYDPVAVLAVGQAKDAEQAFALARHLRTDAADLPHVRSVTVDSRVYHDAHASTVEELAFTLGALAERLARSTERGTSPLTLLDDLQLVVSVSTSYFVEIAKLRALRLLVPQVVAPFVSETGTDRSFSPSDLPLHAETSRRTETIYDPRVNMLRATTEAMAATLGGCDTLSIRPYDASFRPSDDFGTRIARNTQLILRHEAHVDQVADPAAGSYYVETLTDKLAQQAWALLQEVETNGGIVEALRDGSVQRRMKKTCRNQLDAVEERDHVLVGSTHYPALGERRRDDLSLPEGIPPSPNDKAPPVLEAPSMDAIRQALHNGASLPDIYAVLEEEPPAIDPLPRFRVPANIEAIRLRTERVIEAHDGPPRVLLVPLGPTAARSARATFARNVLGVAGFEIEEPLKFDSISEAADAAVEEDADVVVLCSSDAEYAELAPALATALEDRGQDALLLVAGSPDDVDAGGAADLFLYRGCSLRNILETLQDRLDMPVKSET